MSTETILSRMMNEPTFADAVFADADKSLAEYNLPAEDLAKFKGLTRAHFEGMSPEERKSFAVIWEGRAGGTDRGGIKLGKERLGGPSDPQDSPPGSGNHNETALTI